MTFIKTSILLVLLICQIHPSQAQDTRKTMLEQLAALKGYIITAERGYRIAKEGLYLVRDIKAGEFLLHHVFFRSLKTVDEAVMQNPELDEAFRLMIEQDQDDCKELQDLTTNGILSMTDGERIRRINAIAKSLRARHSQIKSFLASVAWLIGQRQKEQAYTETLKKWYGIQ